MCQEFGGHDGADGVPTEVLGSGRTAAVTIEAGKRIGATLFQAPPSTLQSDMDLSV